MMSNFEFNFGEDDSETAGTAEKFSAFSFWENEESKLQSKFFNQDDKDSDVDVNMNINSSKKPAAKSDFMSFDFGPMDDSSDCENSLTLERHKSSKRYDEDDDHDDEDQKRFNGRRSPAVQDPSDVRESLGDNLKDFSAEKHSSIDSGFDYVEKRGTRGFEAAGELEGFMSGFAASMDEAQTKPSASSDRNDIIRQANNGTSGACKSSSSSLFDDEEFASFKEEKFSKMAARGSVASHEQFEGNLTTKSAASSFDNEDLSVSFEARYAATPFKIKKEFIEIRDGAHNEHLSPRMASKSPKSTTNRRFLQSDKANFIQSPNADCKKRRVLFEDKSFDQGPERRSNSPASVESNPLKQKTPKRANVGKMSFDQDDAVPKRAQFNRQVQPKSSAELKAATGSSKTSLAVMQCLKSYRKRVMNICDERLMVVELRERAQSMLLTMFQGLLDACKLVEQRQEQKRARIHQSIRQMIMDEME